MVYLGLSTSWKKSKVPKKGLVVKSMIFSEMNSRAQVDLIDMQSQPDGELKWILVYQDHLTKFVQLRPTKSKCAPELLIYCLIYLAYSAHQACCIATMEDSLSTLLLLSFVLCGKI